LPDKAFSDQNAPNVVWQGAPPGPAGGAYSAPPDHLVAIETPRAFGARS